MKNYVVILIAIGPARLTYAREEFHTILKSPILGWTRANLLARSTPIAFSISGKTWVNNHAHVLQFEKYETRRLVEIYLNSIDLRPYISGGAQPKLNKANLNIIPIPVPSLAEQKRIVAILDKFDALVNDISVGLSAELNARRKQYEYYRNQLLTFTPLEKEHAC